MSNYPPPPRPGQPAEASEGMPSSGPAAEARSLRPQPKGSRSVQLVLWREAAEAECVGSPHATGPVSRRSDGRRWLTGRVRCGSGTSFHRSQASTARKTRVS